jgi:hypothetical protein
MSLCIQCHPPLIYLNTSNHQQTAATNVAPSGDERAQDASRAPSVRFLFLFLSLLTCIYNKIDYNCFQTFKHPHCDVSDHQRKSSRSSRGSDATVILFLFFLFISLIPINYSLRREPLAEPLLLKHHVTQERAHDTNGQ